MISISFFDDVLTFTQQNINQSESAIGDKKLSVELYLYSINFVTFSRDK